MTSGQSVALSVGDVEIVIDVARGARATQWTIAGLSLLTRHGADPVENGMYPMAPWAGRVRDNAVVHGGLAHPLPATYGPWALHGTVLARDVEIVEHVQDAACARLVTVARSHPEWPWPMEIGIVWDLRERELTTVITVRALEEAFPAVVGWHPWFARRLARGEPLQWSLDASSRAERGEDYLPTGRLLPFTRADGPFDDAFVVPDRNAIVRWPGALSLEIANSEPWFVVFDQLPSAACIEPQSGPPNAVNEGIDAPVPMARPDQPHRLITTWTMTDDPPEDRA